MRRDQTERTHKKTVEKRPIKRAYAHAADLFFTISCCLLWALENPAFHIAFATFCGLLLERGLLSAYRIPLQPEAEARKILQHMFIAASCSLIFSGSAIYLGVVLRGLFMLYIVSNRERWRRYHLAMILQRPLWFELDPAFSRWVRLRYGHRR